MNKIKVVIVSDDIDYRMMVKHLVECDDITVSGYAEYNSNAVLKINGLYPDAVIFGVSKDDATRFQIAKDVYLKLKGCSLIMLNETVDFGFATKAMQIGVRNIFPADVTKNDIRKAIIDGVEFEHKRFADERPKDTNCRVFSFFSGKGGVGKTTIAVNTALGLAMKGKKVLIIDGDLQFGDVNLHLDLEPKDTIAELVQERSNLQPETVQSFITLHSSGLGVLCAPKSPEFAEYVTSKHMETIISMMRPYYDYIIVDLTDALNDIAITAGENSDRFFLVCGQEISSLKNAKICMNILDSLQLKDKTSVIVNKSYDNSMIKIKDFDSLLGVKVIETIPDDSKNMLACLNKGTPVISIGRTPAEVQLKKFCDNILKGAI